MKKFFFIIVISVILNIVVTGCSADLSVPNQSLDMTLATQPMDDMQTTSSDGISTTLSQNQPPNSVLADSSAPNRSSDMTLATQPMDDMQTTSSIQSEISKSTRNDKMNNNCKLIVKGREITSENYVYLNEEHRNVELPLTAVMKALGAEVQWQDKTTVIMTFGGNDFVLDTTKQAFGLPRPPGATHFVREIIENEIIVDSTSATGLIVHWMGAKIKINYDEKIVEIE